MENSTESVEALPQPIDEGLKFGIPSIKFTPSQPLPTVSSKNRVNSPEHPAIKRDLRQQVSTQENTLGSPDQTNSITAKSESFGEKDGRVTINGYLLIRSKSLEEGINLMTEDEETFIDTDAVVDPIIPASRASSSDLANSNVDIASDGINDDALSTIDSVSGLDVHGGDSGMGYQHDQENDPNSRGEAVSKGIAAFASGSKIRPRTFDELYALTSSTSSSGHPSQSGLQNIDSGIDNEHEMQLQNRSRGLARNRSSGNIFSATGDLDSATLIDYLPGDADMSDHAKKRTTTNNENNNATRSSGRKRKPNTLIADTNVEHSLAVRVEEPDPRGGSLRYAPDLFYQQYQLQQGYPGQHAFKDSLFDAETDMAMTGNKRRRRPTAKVLDRGVIAPSRDFPQIAYRAQPSSYEAQHQQHPEDRPQDIAEMLHARRTKSRSEKEEEFVHALPQAIRNEFPIKSLLRCFAKYGIHTIQEMNEVEIRTAYRKWRDAEADQRKMLRLSKRAATAASVSGGTLPSAFQPPRMLSQLEHGVFDASQLPPQLPVAAPAKRAVRVSSRDRERERELMQKRQVNEDITQLIRLADKEEEMEDIHLRNTGFSLSEGNYNFMRSEWNLGLPAHMRPLSAGLPESLWDDRAAALMPLQQLAQTAIQSQRLNLNSCSNHSSTNSLLQAAAEAAAAEEAATATDK